MNTMKFYRQDGQVVRMRINQNAARSDFARRDDRSVWRSCISDHPWHRWRPLLVRAWYALLRFCFEQQTYTPEPPPPRFRTRVVRRHGLHYVEPSAR